MGGMKSKVDLHMHSSASDGVDSIAELLAKVKAAGIECFALTDHDTIAGVLAMEKLLAEYGEDAFYADPDTLLSDYFAWDEEAETYRPSWTLGEESLTIWFSPYEIAPYAAGLLHAEIRFDEAPEIFTGNYF